MFLQGNHEIQMLGGKLIPKLSKVQKIDVKNEYTLLDYTGTTRC